MIQLIILQFNDFNIHQLYFNVYLFSTPLIWFTKRIINMGAEKGNYKT